MIMYGIARLHSVDNFVPKAERTESPAHAEKSTKYSVGDREWSYNEKLFECLLMWLTATHIVQRCMCTLLAAYTLQTISSQSRQTEMPAWNWRDALVDCQELVRHCVVPSRVCNSSLPFVLGLMYSVVYVLAPCSVSESLIAC